MIRTRTRVCTLYRAVTLEMPVEIDVETELAENAGHSPKDRLAA